MLLDNNNLNKIVRTVLSVLNTNTRKIGELPVTDDITDSDLFEIGSGKSVTFAQIKNAVMREIGFDLNARADVRITVDDSQFSEGTLIATDLSGADAIVKAITANGEWDGNLRIDGDNLDILLPMYIGADGKSSQTTFMHEGRMYSFSLSLIAVDGAVTALTLSVGAIGSTGCACEDNIMTTSEASELADRIFNN